MRHIVLKLAFGLFLAAGLAAPAITGTAPVDPVPIYPENYTVLFENDQVRVLDFRLRKGATERPHFHPEHVAVFLADFRIRFTLPDGTTAIRDAKAGTAAHSDAVIHSPENIGETDAHGILVELKGVPAGRSRP